MSDRSRGPRVVLSTPFYALFRGRSISRSRSRNFVTDGDKVIYYFAILRGRCFKIRRDLLAIFIILYFLRLGESNRGFGFMNSCDFFCFLWIVGLELFMFNCARTRESD